MGIVMADISVTLDGFGAALDQRLDAPFGDFDADRVHRPGRGEWDLTWTGWWGEDPPYHAPVFVLTTTSAARHTPHVTKPHYRRSRSDRLRVLGGE